MSYQSQARFPTSSLLALSFAWDIVVSLASKTPEVVRPIPIRWQVYVSRELNDLITSGRAPAIANTICTPVSY